MTRIAFLGLLVLAILAAPFEVQAQEKPFSTPAPQFSLPDPCANPVPGDYRDGCYGNGHGKYHHFYKQFFTKTGKSCCSNNECRPTSVKVLPQGGYGIMVDGMLCPLNRDQATLFTIPGVDKVHVCAGRARLHNRISRVCPAIYCIIWDIEAQVQQERTTGPIGAGFLYPSVSRNWSTFSFFMTDST